MLTDFGEDSLTMSLGIPTDEVPDGFKVIMVVIVVRMTTLRTLTKPRSKVKDALTHDDFSQTPATSVLSLLTGSARTAIPPIVANPVAQAVKFTEVTLDDRKTSALL